jgi:hypothetical protein
VKDGIINEKFYSSSNPKVLFLMKEVNDPSESACWDLSIMLYNELKYNFSYRLAEWSWGIFNDFIPLPDNNAKKEKLHSMLRKTAIINLKKSGGGGFVNHDILNQHIIKNKNFIIKQIEIINPEVIIGGLGRTSYWSLFLDNLGWLSSGYDIKIAKWKNIKLVDFYHPSYQVPRAMSYCLLKSVLTSSAFCKL